MKFPERKRLRLAGYDYSLSGGYFVTICTKNRVPWFGEIVNKEMVLSAAGQIVLDQWFWLERQYGEYIGLDQFVVMPDHVHGIIFINNPAGEGLDPPVHDPACIAHDPASGLASPVHDPPVHDPACIAHDPASGLASPVHDPPVHDPACIAHDPASGPSPPVHGPVGRKAMSLPKIIGAFKTTSSKLIHQNGDPDFTWHRSFHDRIIRTPGALERIRHYIFHNPHV